MCLRCMQKFSVIGRIDQEKRDSSITARECKAKLLTFDALYLLD